MDKSPYEYWTEQLFLGERVRVHTPSHEYEGWARAWNHEPPALVLNDVERGDGERLDTVVVQEIVSAEQLGPVESIERVPVDDVYPSPYSAREHEELSSGVRETHLRGHLISYPTATETEDGYELLGGHRRFNTAKHAGLDALPVRLLDLDPWEATRRFVYEHFPLPGERDDRASELYTDEEIARSLDRLRDDWPDETLRELPQLRPFVDSDGPES